MSTTRSLSPADKFASIFLASRVLQSAPLTPSERNALLSAIQDLASGERVLADRAAVTVESLAGVASRRSPSLSLTR